MFGVDALIRAGNDGKKRGPEYAVVTAIRPKEEHFFSGGSLTP